MIILHLDMSPFFHKVIQKSNLFDSVDLLYASSVKDAWEILENHNVDLLLSGQELKDGSLDLLLKKLEKSPYQDIPVILITSSDTLELREKYFKQGVVDFIHKGNFSPEILKEHLDHYEKQVRMIQQLGAASVAILDDSQLSLNVAKSMLTIHQILDVETFHDPEELLSKEKAFDIYLIDLVLPRMSGEQVVLEIRKRYPLSVIIIVSSLEKYNTIVHVLESGADDYIIKPFDARLLMARMKSNYRSYQMMKKLEEHNRFMEKMAITDGLTGAYNHRYLMERLNSEILRARSDKKPLSLLLLDIDKFKAVNDTYGHPNGDMVLKKLSHLFLANPGEKDIFGRYGGEEFMLILPDSALDDAYPAAEQKRKDFHAFVYPEIHRELTVSFSGGLVQLDGRETAAQLIHRADELLYKAKNEGRNNIQT